MTKLWAGHKQVSQTLDLATWFLFATYPLVMMIICAKLFINSTMHNKAMSQHKQVLLKDYAKSLRADCDRDL